MNKLVSRYRQTDDKIHAVTYTGVRVVKKKTEIKQKPKNIKRK